MPASLIAPLLVEAGWSAFAVAAASLAIRVATTYAIASLFNRNQDQPTPTGNGQTGGKVQLPPATDNKLPVVYGRSHVSPVVVDAVLSTDQQVMWYVLALSERTDSGTVTIGDVYWDDKLLVFNPNNPSEITSWYIPASSGGADANARVTGVAGKISMWFYDNGSSSECTHQCLDESNFQFSQQKSNVDAITVMSNDGNMPAELRWDASKKMSNTIFAIAKVVYDQGHAVTGLGQLRVEVKNTLNNPGDVIKDYLLNNRYGCGVSLANVNTGSLTRLKNYSDNTHQLRLTNGELAPAAYYYRINGIVDTNQTCMSNLNSIADCADSWIQWDERNAQWGVVINRSFGEEGYTEVGLTTITKDQIIGGINLNPTDLKTSANKVTVSFPSYTLINQSDYRYYALSQTQRNPNEPDNVLSVAFPFVEGDQQATWLAYKKLWSTRSDLMISFTMDYSGIRINAGDIIRIAHDWYGWGPMDDDANNPYKLFRVSQVKEAKDANGFLSVQISAMEYNDSIYSTTDPGFFELTDFNLRYSGLTDPNIIAVPGTPTVTTSTVTTNVFVVESTVPGKGNVEAMEFWLGTTSTVSTNNFALYESQHYIGPVNQTFNVSLYPNTGSEKINVVNLPAGTYYWAVRARGPNAVTSPFSDVSQPIVWTPILPNGSIDGGSIADGSISGSKVVTGDPATAGQPNQSKPNFIDTLGKASLIALGLGATYYGYQNGWFGGDNAPKDGFVGGFGDGQGQDPSITTMFADNSSPNIGDTVTYTVATSPDYGSVFDNIGDFGGGDYFG